MTPTYLKTRDRNDASLAGEHERYDTKNRQPTSQAWASGLSSRSMPCCRTWMP